MQTGSSDTVAGTLPPLVTWNVAVVSQLITLVAVETSLVTSIW